MRKFFVAAAIVCGLLFVNVLFADGIPESAVPKEILNDFKTNITKLPTTWDADDEVYYANVDLTSFGDAMNGLTVTYSKTTKKMTSFEAFMLSPELPKDTDLLKLMIRPKSQKVILDLVKKYLAGTGVDEFSATADANGKWTYKIQSGPPFYFDEAGKPLE